MYANFMQIKSKYLDRIKPGAHWDDFFNQTNCAKTSEVLHFLYSLNSKHLLEDWFLQFQNCQIKPLQNRSAAKNDTQPLHPLRLAECLFSVVSVHLWRQPLPLRSAVFPHNSHIHQVAFHWSNSIYLQC
jgi:hypothetical protein